MNTTFVSRREGGMTGNSLYVGGPIYAHHFSEDEIRQILSDSGARPLSSWKLLWYVLQSKIWGLLSSYLITWNECPLSEVKVGRVPEIILQNLMTLQNSLPAGVTSEAFVHFCSDYRKDSFLSVSLKWRQENEFSMYIGSWGIDPDTEKIRNTTSNFLP